MADILIRGYSMPNGCGVCPLNTGVFYCAGLKRYVIEEEHVWMGSNYRRLKDCPLHELPEHGDLIDIRNAENAMFALGNYHLSDYRKGWNDGIKAVIENAPVIVPSNKEETE